MSLTPIEHEITVDLAPERAFELFADRLGEWWPLAYTFSGPAFESAQIEPRAGGCWFERNRRGERIAWGAVRAYDRGRRIVLQWGIGTDRKPAPPERSSEVELRFSADGDRTRVTVEHRDFDRHGQGADMLREGMSSEQQGWPIILAEYGRAARRASAAKAR